MRNDPWVDPTGNVAVSTISQRAVRKELLEVAWQLRQIAATTGRHSERYTALQASSFHALFVLQLFRELFPDTPWSKMAKRVTRIERLASRRLELDRLRQHLEVFRGELTGGPREGLPPEIQQERRDLTDVAIAKSRDEQLAIHRSLTALLTDWEQKQIEQHCLAFASHARWRSTGREPSFAEVASRQLARCFELLRQAFEGDLSEVTMLHDIRHAAQQADVLLDIFGTLEKAPDVHELRTELRHTISQVETVLRHAVSRAWFTRWEHDAMAKKERKAFHQLNDWEQSQAPADFATLQSWWEAGNARRILDQSALYFASIDPTWNRGTT